MIIDFGPFFFTFFFNLLILWLHLVLFSLLAKPSFLQLYFYQIFIALFSPLLSYGFTFFF